MRKGLIGLGVLLVVIGAVWTTQGLGYLKGSFMTGDSTWTTIGILCVAGGLALAFHAARKK
ncbi:hypothetical protein PV646_18120 [Streptomyces sp. ID05-26A]|nr:hypothetical protein [Streptomyces sp. ID05-26A]